jgi:peptidoglycan/LPS O-acetylase OafA/YrhL
MLPVWLADGVDVFFVISGCIMWITTAPPLKVSPGSFYWKRAVRIVPLYWLVTSVMAATMLLVPSVFRTARFDAHHAILSYLFIPTLHPDTGKLEPVVIPGWTLNYEMFFYVIFGALLLLPAARRIWVLLAVMISLVVLGTGPAHDPSMLRFYTSDIILEFAAGAVLGWLFLNKPPLPVFAAAGLIALGIVMFPLLSAFFPASPGIFRSGTPAVLIVGGAIALDRRRAVGLFRLPYLLGNASYSIYLCQVIILPVANQFWRKMGLVGYVGADTLYIVFALLSAACGGVMVYYYFERPVMRMLAPRAANQRPDQSRPLSKLV